MPSNYQNKPPEQALKRVLFFRCFQAVGFNLNKRFHRGIRGRNLLEAACNSGMRV